MKLSETLNKTIVDLCENRFTGTAENHCAHFVCHVLELDSGYDCKTHKNGDHPGACIRVQELFAVSSSRQSGVTTDMRSISRYCGQSSPLL
jgi:hypothetical protein